MLGRSADYPGIILYKRMAPYKAHSANDKHSSPILQKTPPSIPKRLIICCFTSCVINCILNHIKNFRGGTERLHIRMLPEAIPLPYLQPPPQNSLNFYSCAVFLIPDKKYLLSCRYWDSLDYEVLFLNLVLHM